jgi:hypothetical protein
LLQFVSLLRYFGVFSELRHYSISPHVCEADKAVHNALLHHGNVYTIFSSRFQLVF